MDRLDQLSIFSAIAQSGSFTAAARQLDVSAPAATRAVAQLEARLGVRLFTRTTRYVRLTEAGERYLADIQPLLLNLQDADAAVRGSNAQPQGTLSITAPVLFGAKYIATAMTQFLSAYPETTVESIFVDRVVNLVEEGFDIGIRIGQLPDSSLQARQVGCVSVVLCATREYLDHHSEPTTPAQLRTHTLIASPASRAFSWRFKTTKLDPRQIRTQLRLHTNTNDAARSAAQSGFGITRLLSYQVEDDFRRGTLVRIMRNEEPPPLPVHILHREGRFHAAKVRAFVDLLTQRLSTATELQDHLGNA